MRTGHGAAAQREPAVSYRRCRGTDRRYFILKAAHVARSSDGKVIPFSIPIHSRFGVGRARWSADGQSILYEGLDDSGRNGVFIQSFSPDLADTAATRRSLVGFDADAPTETFAISPDGTRVVLSNLEARQDILVAEGVRGIIAPRK